MVDAKRSYRDARQLWIDSFEREYLSELLKIRDQNISAAARTAGLGRTFLYRLLWRHGLREAPSSK
jgi:transcriptional regulator of acetoin/glycerol metabolism